MSNEPSDYTSRALPASERPRCLYEYYVTGRGIFPSDMLRHDGCWPATGEDAARLDVRFEDGALYRNPRTVKLRSYREPTIGRWQSFNWAVSGYHPESRARKVNPFDDDVSPAGPVD